MVYCEYCINPIHQQAIKCHHCLEWKSMKKTFPHWIYLILFILLIIPLEIYAGLLLLIWLVMYTSRDKTKYK